MGSDLTGPGPGSPLPRIDEWGATFAAAGVVRAGSMLATHGDTAHVTRVASITKLATAWAVLVAVEEGATTLDRPLGPPGSTVRHVLCHASGLDFETDTVLARPAQRRIYSNTGYQLLGDHIRDETGIDFATYLAEGVLEPLGMTSSELRGSPAKDLFSDLEDMVRLAGELRSPTVIHPDTAAEARSPQFPELVGVLPGWGRQDPCWWGLGPELRATKHPHWTGATASAGTYGHFGGSGTFLWTDPEADLTCVVLTDREFDDWAVAAWPPFSDAVRAAYS